jgi:hypothetical protein
MRMGGDMKHKTIISILAVGIALVFCFGDLSALAPPDAAVALVSKVVLDVTKKLVGHDWVKAERGEVLSTGDKVKTGEKSLAIIKFKDNSLVRLREKTELTVTGESKAGAFSKSVNVERGVVGFNVKKQQPDEEFRFTSPTSVASIRGTGGLFAMGDTLVVVEGMVRFTNTISNDFVDVGAGFTGISNPDGTIETRPSTAAERNAAQSMSRTGEQERLLEFELRDNQGNRRQLKIDIKEP